MERSGHYSIGRVRSYECTTELQKKQVLDIKGLKMDNSSSESDGKEVT